MPSWFYSRNCLHRTQLIIIEKLYGVTLSNNHSGISLFSLCECMHKYSMMCVCMCVCVHLYVFSNRHPLHVSRMSLMKPQVFSQGKKPHPVFLPSLTLSLYLSLSLLCSLRCKPVTHRHQRETQRARYNWCEKHQTQEGRIFYNGEATACRFPIYLHFWPL